MDDLRYPIGKFDRNQGPLSKEARKAAVEAIAELPQKVAQAIAGLNGKQLDTPYREGGWTVRQVVHHLADSHMNAYVRFKLALTEDTPTIKAYKEDKWAELADSRVTPVDVSVTLLDSLHARWVALLRSMKEEDWARKLNHPVAGLMPLDLMAAMYAWHGKHHTAHITGLRQRNQW
ncbi:MAG: putative metal-dependent hydrolase [Acidobacteriota bacterium]|nr:putative metal-dependent hydrolase [Acidobacteriota bacterium]